MKKLLGLCRKMLFGAAILTRIMMALTGVRHGKNLRLNGNAFIFSQGGATIRLGDGVTLNSAFLSNLLGLNHRCIIVARGAGTKIEIGDGCGISGATIYARSGIFIGKNTLIGGNVKILDNDFHPIDVAARNAKDDDAIARKPVCIGENCFIGCNALILKGSKIGDGSTVGAGAIVCGEFPPNSVIAGNPARVIKTLAP